MTDDILVQIAARLFADSPQGMVMIDADERVVAVNPAFTRISGYGFPEVSGIPLRELGAGPQDQETYRQIRAALGRQGYWQGELWGRRKSGETYPQWFTLYTVRDSSGKAACYLGVLADITEQKLLESRLSQLAYHDALTRLPNRLLLQDRIHQALARAVRSHDCLALLFIDLDRFEVVNNNLGHDIGDLLLQAVANRLQECVRAEDTVARQGGDEFVILLPSLRQSQDAALVAQKLIDTLSATPFNLYDHKLHITLSIGISVYPQDGSDGQDLLKNADAAMYYAKEKGGNSYRFYTPDMNVTAFERLSLENSLRRAIERGEFFLTYQPQLDTASGRLLGMEALIRWKHPQQGLIEPAKFIPITEDMGLITPIGEWVLREACQNHLRCREAGCAGLRLAVNLSARQLRHATLPALIGQLLQENQMSPDQLELELGEDSLGQLTEPMRTTLGALSELGVRLAVDDFGSGYASLSEIKRFPIQRLKIDTPLIGRSVTDPDAAAIVSAIIAMAHNLGLEVIAEGVENEEQLVFLRQRQCDIVQGYHLSPPLSGEALIGFLQALPQAALHREAPDGNA